MTTNGHRLEEIRDRKFASDAQRRTAAANPYLLKIRRGQLARRFQRGMRRSEIKRFRRSSFDLSRTLSIDDYKKRKL